MRAAAAKPSGFTLIELVIVIAVIGILGAAAIPAMNAATGANVRSAAGELSGAARYLFETAALRHETCRLALDLDGAAWWAECTKDRAFSAREPSSAPEREEDDAALAERFPEERDAEKRRLLAGARFTQFTDRLARKRALPGSARFDDVWSEHQREPFDRGMAYVYFFPQGRAEEARVPVKDGDNAYTVVLQAFTGRARVVPGVPEAPRQ